MIFYRLTVSRLFDEKSCRFLLFKAFSFTACAVFVPRNAPKGLVLVCKGTASHKKAVSPIFGLCPAKREIPLRFLPLTNRFSHSPKGLPSKKNADASFLKSLPFLNESNYHLIKKRCVPTVLVIELSPVSG